MPNKKQTWQCDRCLVTVTTYIKVSEPPSHACPKAASKPRQLSPKEGQ